MNKRWILLFNLFLFFSVISCKKDNTGSGNSNSITGNWKFVSLTAQTESDNQYTNTGVVYKTATLSSYTSTANSGTAYISLDSMVGYGISYTIATTLHVYDYQDGQLIDSTQVPFNFSIPPIITGTTYQLIGQDSIYFPGRSFFGGQQGVESASGAKYTLNGSTLTMTSSVVKDSTSNSYGFPMTIHEASTVKTILQKQ